jgi:hypothetical protein
MSEMFEWEKAQLKPSDFSPLGLKVFKALFSLGISVPLTLALYGIVTYLIGWTR